MLSLLMVSSFIVAFDNSDPKEIIDAMHNESEGAQRWTFQDYQKVGQAIQGKAEEFVGAAKQKGEILLDGAKRFIFGTASVSEDVQTPLVETPELNLENGLPEPLTQGNTVLEPELLEQTGEALKESANTTLGQVPSQNGSNNLAPQVNPPLNIPFKQSIPEDTLQESSKRFAILHQAWNSKAVQFTCDMFNPCAHGRAWKDMWQAGFKGAVPKLWDEHKAVIAGTVVITAAVATSVYYAHKKGWLAKAKALALDLQKQYFVTSA